MSSEIHTSDATSATPAPWTASMSVGESAGDDNGADLSEAILQLQPPEVILARNFKVFF